jgi:hypothetical protein
LPAEEYFNFDFAGWTSWTLLVLEGGALIIEKRSALLKPPDLC